jgi:purine nucleosidase
MPRKVILDIDPGIDDAIALTMALFDPQLEVVGVTAVGGNVAAPQASRNVQGLVEWFDPPRWPRIGSATQPENQVIVDTCHLFGNDGLGNLDLQVAELHHQHPSHRVLVDLVKASPGEVTIIALGPLTNVARAIQHDLQFADQVDQLIVMGGSVSAGGNVTAAAEFNIYCDPQAAAAVFDSKLTMTVVPLDVTNQLTLTYDALNQLPDLTTKAGRLLRHVLPFAFRTHRQILGLEGVLVHDAVALAAATHRELFQTQRIPVEVEVAGGPAVGATIFDRRSTARGKPNLEVATEVDAPAVLECIMSGLRRAGETGD